MTITLDLTDPDLLAELGEIVAETLDGLLESEAVTLPMPEVAGHDDVVIQSYVPINGDGLAARLVVRVSAATAISLTSALADEPVNEIDLEEARGTMAELCNVLAGSAKTLFDDETALDIPTSAIVPVGELDDLPMVETYHEVASIEVHLEAL